eukprot:Skav231845  [mRNA]  locus=scaffold2215:311436:318178:+ [translate_table: standard]
MSEKSSSDSELPVAKKPREEAALGVRLRSATTGEQLISLHIKRSSKLGILKEMIEAAVRIPKQAQRLLFQTEELKEDDLELGSLLPQDAQEVDLTIIKQKTAPDALFTEAQGGNGSSCLAMFQLPDIAELLQYVHEASQRSCLHAAAEQRLSATCHAILNSPHFPHLNLISVGRMTALHSAIRSELPDVCSAILSRNDYRDHRGDTKDDISVLHFAILHRHTEALEAMVPLLSSDSLLETFPKGFFPSWFGGWKRYEGLRPQEVCEQIGMTEIANVIKERAPMSGAEAASRAV